MAEQYLHLEIIRGQPENERRRRRGYGVPPPSNPKSFAKKLGGELAAHTPPPPEEIPGFDPRRLLKLTVEGISADELTKLPGISVVSEEGKNITVLFATEAGLSEFQHRLKQISAGRMATRQAILFAVKKVEEFTPQDRMGTALRVEGVPKEERFLVDVELWPLELAPEREAMVSNFLQFCKERGLSVVDAVNNSAVVIERVEVTKPDLEALLNLRDVRQVDLPPQYQLDFSLAQVNVSSLPGVPSPPNESPGIVILDSGLVSNHPLIAPAVGDSQGFASEEDTGEDSSGHGTHVAGLALYGDVERCVESGLFKPALRVFSGRIADSSGDTPNELLENRIEEAVRYFREHYGCRVFNLSFGDSRKPYGGTHVDRLAATVDTIAREQDVLFIVSAGNFHGTHEGPKDWRGSYPEYLLTEEARILDPAPAINALTVGSLARYEKSRMASRYRKDPAYQPIARRDEPSPFTRSGPGVGGGIKPELVEYGGNLYVDTRSGTEPLWSARELGELSTNMGFAGGNLLTANFGTSVANTKGGTLSGSDSFGLSRGLAQFDSCASRCTCEDTRSS